MAGAIVAGQLHDALDVVIDAVNLRVHVVARQQKDAALARLSLGDRVRFVDTAKPQYLRGATDEIDEVYQDLVVVCLDRAVGKFRSGHVRTSPELLERLGET